jgi:hypothetical protein
LDVRATAAAPLCGGPPQGVNIMHHLFNSFDYIVNSP